MNRSSGITRGGGFSPILTPLQLLHIQESFAVYGLRKLI